LFLVNLFIAAVAASIMWLGTGLNMGVLGNHGDCVFSIEQPEKPESINKQVKK